MSVLTAGFINALSISNTDPRYVAALRISLVQLEMVAMALEQEYRSGLTTTVVLALLNATLVWFGHS